MRRQAAPVEPTASDVQQRYNDHRAVCRRCFAHTISALAEAPQLCEFGRKLQENWAARYALEKPEG